MKNDIAENEVTLLKVLDGPTIIHYYKHFIKADMIYILMECAEGGSLDGKIQHHKTTGEPIHTNQVYFIKLVLNNMS